MKISSTLIDLVRLVCSHQNKRKKMPERLGLCLDLNSNSSICVMTFKGQLLLAKQVENWSWYAGIYLLGWEGVEDGGGDRENPLHCITAII
jgi:hypothetical protein